MLKIEKGIPVAERRYTSAQSSYNETFSQMEVGDSFALKGEGKKMALRLSVAVSNFRKKATDCPHKFTVRNLGNSARVWRIA